MRLIFCVREHTFDEIYMGHPLGFPAIHGVEAISATANARGFTPLTAIARTYGWRREHLALALINRLSQQASGYTRIFHRPTKTIYDRRTY